jgi:hypothetical protein
MSDIARPPRISPTCRCAILMLSGPTMLPMPTMTSVKLLSTYRRLKAAGKLPHWPISHGVTTSMYYRDPDNNRVELQIDNFATSAELDGYFHSRTFAENPVGVTYESARSWQNSLEPAVSVQGSQFALPAKIESRSMPLTRDAWPWLGLPLHLAEASWVRRQPPRLDRVADWRQRRHVCGSSR